jgi:hypothetical protein
MAKLSGKARAKYEASRDLGQELLAAAREIKGGLKPTHRVHHIKVPAVLEARLRSGLSQQQFANILGVSRLASHVGGLGTGTSKSDGCCALAADDRGKAPRCAARGTSRLIASWVQGSGSAAKPTPWGTTPSLSRRIQKNGAYRFWHLYRGVTLHRSITCMGCKGSRVQISALRPAFL